MSCRRYPTPWERPETGLFGLLGGTLRSLQNLEQGDETMSMTPSKPGKGTAWNSGKLIGPKPPLQAKHVWAIRTHLQLAGKPRDLALFNLAIDSKPRGCDVVAIKVADVAPHGYALDRATIRQRKTGRPVKFELTAQTRDAVDAHVRRSGKTGGDYLFDGRGIGSTRLIDCAGNPSRQAE